MLAEDRTRDLIFAPPFENQPPCTLLTTARVPSLLCACSSWGAKWADHGYVYLPRGFDGGKGWNGYCGHFFASGAHVYTMGDPSYYYEQ